LQSALIEALFNKYKNVERFKNCELENYSNKNFSKASAYSFTYLSGTARLTILLLLCWLFSFTNGA